MRNVLYLNLHFELNLKEQEEEKPKRKHDDETLKTKSLIKILK